MKIINTTLFLLVCLLYSTSSFAAWERIGKSEAGAIGSYGSPTVQFVYQYTVTQENTIDSVSFPTAGGCISSIWIDFMTPVPDSITMSMKNSGALVVPGLSTDPLIADGWVKAPNDGKWLCVSKNFSYHFTGTVAVGDIFQVYTDVMVND